MCLHKVLDKKEESSNSVISPESWFKGHSVSNHRILRRVPTSPSPICLKFAGNIATRVNR